VTYRGGLASENSLPLYDGTTSIHGIGQALQIATHAFMTGEVVSRATALKGASIIMKPARQGSFIVDMVVLIEQYPAVSSVSAAIGAPVFYDFVKTAFRRATGSLEAEPETAHLRNIYNRKEPLLTRKRPADLDELAETLEGSLQRAHRPIGDGGTVNSIEVGSPRRELITLNDETKDWVNTREEAPSLELFRANVTRFNSISRNGRAYIDQFEKVIPFRPDGDFAAGDLPLLTWSLHGSNSGLPSKLEMRMRRVNSASGKIKRLLLADCRRAPED
jgi:hypothetical protein